MTQSIPQTLPDQTNANLLAAAKVILQEFGTSSDGLQELYQAVNAAIIANASVALSQPMGVAAIPEGMALVKTFANTDEIVTRLYRRFKEWSVRGFGPEDVTWCEVKADINAMLSQPPAGQQPGYSKSQVKRLATHIGWEPKGAVQQDSEHVPDAGKMIADAAAQGAAIELLHRCSAMLDRWFYKYSGNPPPSGSETLANDLSRFIGKKSALAAHGIKEGS